MVQATDRNEAEKKAIDLVKQEVEALDVLCNSPKDPPTFVVDKVREVDSFRDARVPGKGFALFPDEIALRADDYFEGIGVGPDTATRIPGNRD